MPKQKMQRYTKKDFDAQFHGDATCLEWLKNYLYPEGIQCKKCGRVTKHHRVASRPSYSCDVCGNHVHPTAGTIFHKSPTPLTIWFYAIYLMSSTRCGISAKQIERETGVTYKTAWRMFKQIRSMLAECDTPMGGEGTPGVEADEMYFGGKNKNKHLSKRKGFSGRTNDEKTPVFGVVERGGRVMALVTPNAMAKTVLPVIHERVLPATVVYTDDYPIYDKLAEHANGYQHRRIQHTQKVYVMGDIHTNTIEGFWSLIKRGIGGVYHSVGSQYLQSYLNEYSFRYNRRFDTQPMFVSFLNQISKDDFQARKAQITNGPF